MWMEDRPDRWDKHNSGRQYCWVPLVVLYNSARLNPDPGRKMPDGERKSKTVFPSSFASPEALESALI